MIFLNNDRLQLINKWNREKGKNKRKRKINIQLYIVVYSCIQYSNTVPIHRPTNTG